MAKLLPKKILDEGMVKKLVEYYKLASDRFDVNDLVEWECFSHPSLEHHECNSRALLPGRHKCDSCSNKVGKLCDISCDMQNFCLAVYAWRMGVGGKDFIEALDHNLYKLKPDELYAEVTKTFSLEELEEVTNEGKPLDVSIPSLPNGSSLKEKEETVELASNLTNEVTDKEATQPQQGSDLLTIQEAANVYGCTYANIYNYTKSGALLTVKSGGKTKVRRDHLDQFKSRPHAKRKKRSV